MNKKLIIAICLFLGGMLGSGLFAVAQAVSNVAAALGEQPQNICGVLCFCSLAILVVGLVFVIEELTKKEK